MPTDRTLQASTICVDRRRLLNALTRVGWVVPSHTSKPILKGVQLEAANCTVRLSATDLDVSLSTTVATEGDLPACVVSFADLVRRIKATKAEMCSIRLDRESDVLIINGGSVEHRIKTMDVKDFPPVPDQPAGAEWKVVGWEFRNALGVALRAVASEPTRYAINGVLLEAGKDEAHVAATDGRRLVVIGLNQQEGQFKGQAILPRQAARLVVKLIDRKGTEMVAVFVKANTDDKGKKQPADLFMAGPDWLLACTEEEGCFPQYRDVIPQSHSRFIVDRAEFIDTLNGVALATNAEQKCVRLELTARSVRVVAGAAELGESSGTVAAEFVGGGDDHIITGFNPDYLLDALKTLPDDRVVIDIEQNRRNALDNKVWSRPALIHGLDAGAIRWVVMSINLGLLPSRETLGSNFDDPNEEPEKTKPKPAPTGEPIHAAAKPQRMSA